MSIPVWTVRGESGKTLDEVERLASVVGMGGAVLEVKSLEVDTLTWVQVDGIIPDELQTISLYCNGVREFTGRITQRKYVYQSGGGSGYAFTASGALFEMANAQIVEEAADGLGNTAARATLQFATGDLRDMVIRLLSAAPGISVGSVERMFSVGRQTFTGGTWLAVLIELLKPVADVSGWIDYTATPPTLNIERRPYMETIRIQIGVDDIDRIELAPKTSLKVTGIALATASRDSTGAIVYSVQTAGDGSQIVSVSGPEIGPFVPPDNLPSTTIQTSALTDALVSSLDSGLASIKNKFAGIPGGVANILDRWTGTSTSKVYSPIPFPDQVTFNEAGTVVTYPAKYIVISGSLPDWAMDELGGVRVKVTGNWLATTTDGTYTDAFNAMIEAGSGGLAGFENSTSGDTTKIYYAAMPFAIELTMIDVQYATSTLVYARAAYEFLTAPAGMAEGMFQAANFVPWQGEVALNPPFPWQRFIGRRLNVAGGDPAMEHAGALIQGFRMPLDTAAVTLRIGAPERVSLDSVVSRYQPSAKDNIVAV